MMNKLSAWNITKCRATYKNRKSANYTFYIVDYDIEDDKKSTILEMRNVGLTKTKYFRTKKEAMKFLHNYQVS